MHKKTGVMTISGLILFLILFASTNYTLNVKNESMDQRTAQAKATSPSQKAANSPSSKTATSSPFAELPVAPDFNLKTLDGPSIHLNDYRGHNVLLVAWATWCSECRKDMKKMVALQEQSQKKDLKILAVNMTTQELSVKDVRKMAKEENWPFPVLLDEKGKVMKEYQIVAIPTSILIDSYGKILHVFKGIVNPKNILNWLPQG